MAVQKMVGRLSPPGDWQGANGGRLAMDGSNIAVEEIMQVCTRHSKYYLV